MPGLPVNRIFKELSRLKKPRCIRCNRVLKDPLSIILGMGPECRKTGRRKMTKATGAGNYRISPTGVSVETTGKPTIDIDQGLEVDMTEKIMSMLQIVLAPLEVIKSNPFQPREMEDEEHIQKLAQSIAEDGLLQTPVGRLIDGDGDPEPFAEALQQTGEDKKTLFDRNCYGVELAFGHSRLAAFRLLQKAGRTEFAQMPVLIRDIPDEEMFRLAIRENLERKALTPIEEARAMARYRNEFGKTSAEIGALFGLSESAVRNKLRLIDLPDVAQEKLANGEISEGTACGRDGTAMATPAAGRGFGR